MIHYDRQGKPITIEQWGRLFEDEDYRRVGLDVYPHLFDDQLEHVLKDEPIASVSTVWLGINHAWRAGPPLIYESMIFGGEYDQEQMRYSTEDEAIDGHRRIVEDLRAGRAPWWCVERDAYMQGGECDG